MNFFLDALARLKKQLRVSMDMEVAELLGMSKNAFAERKKRGSFPEREVVALQANRPELGLDIDYIFTGVSTLDYKSSETKAAKSGKASTDQERVMGVFAALTPASQKQILGIALRLRELEMLSQKALNAEPEQKNDTKGNIHQSAKGDKNIQIGHAGGKVSIKN